MEMFTLYDNSSTVGQCGQGPPLAACARHFPGGRAASINVTIGGPGTYGLPCAKRRTRRGRMYRLSGPENSSRLPLRTTQHAQDKRARASSTPARNQVHHVPVERPGGDASIRLRMATCQGADHDTEADQGCGFANSGTR
jgi:hypothetical protein